MVEKQRRPAHQTQWAAQFAVASELCKRGYEVALTMGNHPRKDLMVSSPGQRQFSIDVKGLYKRNFWLVREKEPDENLFYVFAFVPNGAPNEFFVLTQEEVNKGIQEDFAHTQDLARKKGKQCDENTMPCISPKYIDRFKDAWHSLPE